MVRYASRGERHLEQGAPLRVVGRLQLEDDGDALVDEDPSEGGGHCGRRRVDRAERRVRQKSAVLGDSRGEHRWGEDLAVTWCRGLEGGGWAAAGG